MFLCNVGSRTGYTIHIYLYQIRYRVPERVKYSSVGSVVRYQILLFDIFIGSGTGYRTLCQIGYWVPDPIFFSSVLGTGSHQYLSIPDLVLGTRSC